MCFYQLLAWARVYLKAPEESYKIILVHLFGRYSSKAYCVLSIAPSGGNREGMAAVKQETEVTYREYGRGLLVLGINGHLSNTEGMGNLAWS